MIHDGKDDARLSAIRAPTTISRSRRRSRKSQLKTTCPTFCVNLAVLLDHNAKNIAHTGTQHAPCSLASEAVASTSHFRQLLYHLHISSQHATTLLSIRNPLLILLGPLLNRVLHGIAAVWVCSDNNSAEVHWLSIASLRAATVFGCVGRAAESSPLRSDIDWTRLRWVNVQRATLILQGLH